MFTVRDTKNISVNGMNKIVLNETQIHLHPDDEKTTRFVPFNVPEGVTKLCITYAYAPKILEDRERSIELIRENLIRDAGEDWTEYTDYEEFMPLKNLVTLYLRSPEGFRGAAHRQADSQYHEIGEDSASVGFLKGKIKPGEWQLCLNVHALVTDFCVCQVEIEAEVS